MESGLRPDPYDEDDWRDICDICEQDVTDIGTTDEGTCWDCVEAAEDITGKQLAERRVFFNEGGFTAWWEDAMGNVLDEDDVLIDWPSTEDILKFRGITL